MLTDDVARVIAVTIVGVPTAWWVGKLMYAYIVGGIRYWAYMDGYCQGYEEGKEATDADR